MEAQQEEELLRRIREALVMGFPVDFKDKLLAIIARWYGWAARNEPGKSFAAEVRPPCRLCGRLLPSAYAEGAGSDWRAAPVERTLHAPRGKESRFGICRPCLETASTIARDENAPLRDMVRSYALRGLAEDGEARLFLERLAELYPDFQRLPGPCALCGKEQPTVGAALARLCGPCLDRFAEVPL